MDFGKILNQWEGREKPGKGKRETSSRSMMESWLDKYGVEEGSKYGDSPPQHNTREKGERRRYLRSLDPQDEIDLHGCTVEQALLRTESFLERSIDTGLEKVLIIHGKGNHGEGTGILKKSIREFIEKSKLTGEFGYADRSQGGTGALWVILRQRSR